MAEAVKEARKGTEVEERLIGTASGPAGGPILLCVAGIHGNEPAGVHAVRRVLAALDSRLDKLEGSLVALAGNLAALKAGRRFVDRDLNRAWTRARLEQLRSNLHPRLSVDTDHAHGLCQMIIWVFHFCCRPRVNL